MVGLLDKIKPMSRGQEVLINALRNNEYEIVGVFGPTGTGKSLISCTYGIGAVLDGKYKRFILARPLIDVRTGREITALDVGELYYTLVYSYLEDVMVDVLSPGEIKKLLNEGKIVVADSHFLRGRTFDDSVIFLDDVQSTYPEIVAEIIMRIGRNSKLIVAGDPVFQRDPTMERDGATLIREILLGEEKAIVVDLGLADIVRPGAKRGIRLALELRVLKRQLNNIEKSILEIARMRAPDAEILTVVEFTKEKKEFNISSEVVPDALIIVKERSLGRLVGRGGERIKAMEKETGFKLRAIELTLNFKQLITAVHPVSWIGKHITHVDFVGPELQVTVSGEGIGAFLGQGGSYVKFVDSIIRKLINVGIRAVRERRTRARKKG
ncbi:MAG: PhoH family protein [Thermoprotei archaeon]|nr:MAG: PhoH family protein [Thermoprotei archaeon]